MYRYSVDFIVTYYSHRELTIIIHFSLSLATDSNCLFECPFINWIGCCTRSTQRERKRENKKKNREIVELEKKKKRTIFLDPVVLCQIRSLWGLATHSDRNPIFPVFKKSSVFLHLSLGETRSSLQHPTAFSSFSKRPRKSNFSPSATCASSLAQVSGFCWWITDCDTLSYPQHFWIYWTP